RALGIRHVGQVAAKALARRFGTLKQVRSASSDALEALDGVGPAISTALQEYFADPTTAAMIDRLEASGVATTESVGVSNGPRPLAGQIVVLTGSLPTLSRAEATAHIEAAGGV